MQVFQVLRSQKLYANIEKCEFFTSQQTFLGDVVSAKVIQVDPSKFKAIQTWPVPMSITKVRSFHGWASFYMRFIKDFSSLMAPITECLKRDAFEQTKATQRAFDVPMGGQLNQPKVRPSNQEIKSTSLLIQEILPRLLSSLNPKITQLCWLIS